MKGVTYAAVDLARGDEATRLALERVWPAVPGVLAAGEAPSMTSVLRAAWSTWDGPRMRAAAGVGTQGHRLIECELRGTPYAGPEPDPGATMMLQAFRAYREHHKCRPLAVELPVWSWTLRVAGRLDLIEVGSSGGLVVTDWKGTARHAWQSLAQMAGYGHAAVSAHYPDQPVAECRAVRLPTTEERWDAMVSRNGGPWEVLRVERPDLPICLAVCREAVRLWHARARLEGSGLLRRGCDPVHQRRTPTTDEAARCAATGG